MAGLAGLGRPGDVPFVPRFGAFRDEVLEPGHHQTRRRNERGVDLLLHVRQAPIQPRNLELHAGVERVETPDFRPERRFQCVEPSSRAVRRSRPASFGRKKRPFGVESRPRFCAASMQPGFAAGDAAVCGTGSGFEAATCWTRCDTPLDCRESGMYHMRIIGACRVFVLRIAARTARRDRSSRITGAHIVDAFLIRAPNRAAAPGRAAESARAGRRRQEAGGAIERER